MHYIRNDINIYNLIRHARIRICHSFSALSVDLLSFIGGFEIDLTSCFFRWVSTGLTVRMEIIQHGMHHI